MQEELSPDIQPRRRKRFGCHLLVEQFPYTSWIPVGKAQEADQHGQEEHHVDHENADAINDAPVGIQDYAGFLDRVVCSSDLGYLRERRLVAT